MDVSKAEKFCRKVLADRGNPPAIDYDDLYQEYALGFLDGRGGPEAVMEWLGAQLEEQSKRITVKADCLPGKRVDPGETDQSVDDDKYFEEEILFAINSELAAPIYKMLCDDVPHDRAEVFKRLHGIQREKEESFDIAKSLGWTQHQVTDCVAEVVRVIRRGLEGVKVGMPLFGVVEKVKLKRERAYREIRQKDKSMPLLAG